MYDEIKQSLTFDRFDLNVDVFDYGAHNPK